MKTIKLKLLLLIIIVFQLSCNLTNSYTIFDLAPDPNFNQGLFHKYSGESSVNSNSNFGVVNRKIEFEYRIIEVDSIVDVNIMLTTGFNEGELLEGIELFFENGVILSLKTSKVISREYSENYSYSTSTPVTKHKTITDPGGVDIVVQEDGTHKHVHRPGSTKTVNVTENETNNHSESKSQIFNQIKFKFQKADLEILRSIPFYQYKLNFQNGHIFIIPNRSQRIQLENYL